MKLKKYAYLFLGMSLSMATVMPTYAIGNDIVVESEDIEGEEPTETVDVGTAEELKTAIMSYKNVRLKNDIKLDKSLELKIFVVGTPKYVITIDGASHKIYTEEDYQNPSSFTEDFIDFGMDEVKGLILKNITFETNGYRLRGPKELVIGSDVHFVGTAVYAGNSVKLNGGSIDLQNKGGAYLPSLYSANVVINGGEVKGSNYAGIQCMGSFTSSLIIKEGSITDNSKGIFFRGSNLVIENGNVNISNNTDVDFWLNNVRKDAQFDINNSNFDYLKERPKYKVQGIVRNTNGKIVERVDLPEDQDGDAWKSFKERFEWLDIYERYKDGAFEQAQLQIINSQGRKIEVDNKKEPFEGIDGKKYGYAKDYKTIVIGGLRPYLVTIEGSEVREPQAGDENIPDEPTLAEKEAKAEEDKRKEEARRREEEEDRRKAEEEKQRKAEEDRRKAEEEKKRKAEEDRRKAEEEKQRKAEEDRRKAEEEKQRKAEEDRRKAEEEKQRKVEEDRRKAEEEKQRKAEEEANRRRIEEENKRRAEEENRKRTEEENRRKAEEENRRRTEEENRRRTEEENRKRAEEEATRQNNNAGFSGGSGGGGGSRGGSGGGGSRGGGSRGGSGGGARGGSGAGLAKNTGLGTGSGSVFTREIITDKPKTTSGSWQANAGKWKLDLGNGRFASTQWAMLGDKWYVFDKANEMATGFWKVDKVPYFFNTDGSMAKGWIKDGTNNWYYFDTNSGAMHTGWLGLAGKWYYIEPSGIMAKDKWIEGADKKKYYLKEDGSMAVNEATKDGHFVDANGVQIR